MSGKQLSAMERVSSLLPELEIVGEMYKHFGIAIISSMPTYSIQGKATLSI